jgi:phosphonopyruvate decarboxylase
MIDTRRFGELLKNRGFTFFSGVPCSLLKGLINHAINNFDYVTATNEGEAVAIAAGAHLAGRKSCVLMQNSGFTNALNPLTSLNSCFQIPVLGFVSWRGEPGTADEPEHDLMGGVLPELLDVCRIPRSQLSTEMEGVKEQLGTAERHYERGEPFFFIVKRGTFSEEPLTHELDFHPYGREVDEKEPASDPPTRLELLTEICRHRDHDTALLASTGKAGRELFELGDDPGNLYMVGSMGCVSSISLGLALNRPAKRFVAIDGDGALLMRMGSLATNGYYRPANLLHVLLDNGSHESTGGQQTVSANVGFTRIASQAGYERSIRAGSLQQVGEAMRVWKKNPALTFIHAVVRKGSKAPLGRPTVSPVEVKNRFMGFVSDGGTQPSM